jgi:hypothetical protein
MVVAHSEQPCSPRSRSDCYLADGVGILESGAKRAGSERGCPSPNKVVPKVLKGHPDADTLIAMDDM